MKGQVMRFWYMFIQHTADKLDGFNTENDHMYTVGNEALRRVAQEMLAHNAEVTDTQEMPVVDLGEAS
jgi:hypothetical protein